MMTPISSAVALRAEFKPLLSILNLTLEFGDSEFFNSTKRVSIEPHSIYVKSNRRTVVFPLHSLTLRPASCRGLHWGSPGELQLTLQAEWNTDVGGGDADKCNVKKSDRITHPTNQNLLVSRIEACQSRCFCSGCGAHILKSNCHFKRVLPLPSENWSDFADIWFCHNHSHKNDDNHGHNHAEESTVPEAVEKIRNEGLSPRQNDCLVSSLYMLVDSTQVNPCAITVSLDCLMCKRCGNFLGFIKLDKKRANMSLSSVLLDHDFHHTYKLYFHAICFRDDFENVPISRGKLQHSPERVSVENNYFKQPVEEFMCHLLKDQSHIFTSFRFIIDSSFQSDTQHRLLILLWLLDQDLVVMSSSTSPVDLPYDELSPSPSETDAQEIPIKVVPSKALKLLYKVSFPSLKDSTYEEQGYTEIPNVFKAWQKDNTVHGISLPHPLCKQLVSLLVQSTKKLAFSQRSLNGFHVGYLKMR